MSRERGLQLTEQEQMRIKVVQTALDSGIPLHVVEDNFDWFDNQELCNSTRSLPNMISP